MLASDARRLLVRPGEITEIVGALSSGRTSLVMCALADLTRGGTATALVDADGAFDPATAARAGVVLERLLWVRCARDRTRALRAADLLVRCPGFGAVALDVGETPPALTLTAAFRLKLAVRERGAALLIVGRRRITGPGAALVLQTTQTGQEWTRSTARPTRFAALRTAVRVLRSRGPWMTGLVSDADWRWSA
jgi:hypothetical protein